jgi:hypothetical protein
MGFEIFYEHDIIPVCVVSNHFWWFHILAHLYPSLYVFLCTMLVFAFCWMDVSNLDSCFHFKLVIILNYQICDFLNFVQLHKFTCFHCICCNKCYKASLVLKCCVTWICFGFVGWSNFVLCYSQIWFCLTHNMSWVWQVVVLFVLFLKSLDFVVFELQQVKVALWGCSWFTFWIKKLI